jgi:predicted dehydrogenase
MFYKMLFNIAIIGMGTWGKNLIKEFSKISNVKMVCSKGNINTKEWVKKFFPDTTYTKNINEVLSNKDIDAVVICTPIDTHFQLVYDSLSSGKHVFVEKPLAENPKDAKSLLNLAKKKKCGLFVGYVFTFDPILKKIKKIIQKDSPYLIILKWDKLGSFLEDTKLNLISHEFSIIVELLGIPKNLEIKYNVGYISDSDIVYLEIKYDQDVFCLCEINKISNIKRKTLTLATKKNLYLWENNKLFKFNKRNQKYDLYYNPTKTPLEMECKEFIGSLKNKFNYQNPLRAIEIQNLIKKIQG